MNTKYILGSTKTEYWLLAGIVVLLLASLFLSAINPNKIVDVDLNAIDDYTTRSIVVEEQEYTVLVADTLPKRITGLSYRTELPGGIDGMLFTYSKPGPQSIWMKDMNFSIDILWLDENFKIVHKEGDVSPDTFPESFSSPIPASYVLELPS